MHGETGKNTLIVDSSDAFGFEISQGLMTELRSSVIFLGAMLARMKKASVYAPGGCEIGLRPIDLHLNAMNRLGATVTCLEGNLFLASPDGLRGTVITFSFPSVGATENAVLAASLAKGETVILNAAREPEITDLCNFLNHCGAKTSGAGESVIVIEGVQKLHGVEYAVICDRIAASTYLSAAAITGGDVAIKNTVPAHLDALFPLWEEAGCAVTRRCNEIRLRAPNRLNKMNKIITQPYPGFPTDAQAVFAAMASVADGTTVMVENIFESRFKHIPELIRMGASIRTESRVAVIDGVKRLYGATVESTDLRGGSALTLAGLCTDGMTTVKRAELIDRGYEDFENNLCALNADVKRIN